MANTPNYSLLKPDRTDNINDVDTSLANNFTIIDTEIKNRKDEIDGHIAGTNGQHTSEAILHADGSVKATLDNHESRLGSAETELTDHEGRLTDIETLGIDKLAPDLEGRLSTVENDVEGFLAPATMDGMSQQGYTFDEYRIGYVDNKLTPINEQLAESTTLLSSFPIVVPEVDDTARLRRAIDQAILKKTVLDLKSTALTISDKVSVPRYAKIIGNQAVISSQASGKAALEIATGDNFISGIQIEGNGVAKHGIVILPNCKNVFIEGIEVRNTYGDTVSGSYGIQIQNGCSNIHITKSWFHDISQPENGIEGDAYGASRAILVGEVTRSSISQCRFERIGGFEDGDCIQVQTNTDGTLGWTYSRIVIEKNEFYDVKKRAIKLQGSGVIVLDNYIESNYVDATNCPVSGISSFGSYNTIRENVIHLLRGNFGIEISGGIQITAESNQIEVDKAKAYSSGRSGSTQSGILITSGVAGVRIIKNDILANQVGIYSTVATSDIKIKENTFLRGNTNPIDITSPTLIDIMNNTFLGIDGNNPYEAIKLRSPSNFKIGGNTFERTGHAVRLFGVLNVGKIMPNLIVQADFYKYRTTDVTSGIDTLEIMDGATSGTTANRPTYKKEVGFKYFDTTLGQDVIWDGTKWLEKKQASAFLSGDGAWTSKTIAHGLSTAPSTWIVQEASVDAGNAEIKYVTADATNLTVYFKTAPITGSANVVLRYRVET